MNGNQRQKKPWQRLSLISSPPTLLVQLPSEAWALLPTRIQNLTSSRHLLCCHLARGCLDHCSHALTHRPSTLAQQTNFIQQPGDVIPLLPRENVKPLEQPLRQDSPGPSTLPTSSFSAPLFILPVPATRASLLTLNTPSKPLSQVPALGVLSAWNTHLSRGCIRVASFPSELHPNATFPEKPLIKCHLQNHTPGTSLVI